MRVHGLEPFDQLMTYFDNLPRLGLEREFNAAIHGGPPPAARRIGAWLRARKLRLPCRVLAVYLKDGRPELLAARLRGKALVLAIHPALAYVIYNGSDAAVRRQLRALPSGEAQAMHGPANLIPAIQTAIVALRACQLAPLFRKLGAPSFEAELRARTLAAEAVRSGARDWQSPLRYWSEVLLVRHYRQLNTLRRKFAEFLALLTRERDAVPGFDWLFGQALRELYSTFAINEFPARFAAQIALLRPTLLIRRPGELSITAGTPRSESVARALTYMQAHCSESIGLAEIAAAVHVSAPHLSRLFRRETGGTLTEHLQGLRVARTQELLAGSTLDVLRVALQAGFPTLEHFYRVFKRHTGLTPKAYRRARQA